MISCFLFGRTYKITGFLRSVELFYLFFCRTYDYNSHGYTEQPEQLPPEQPLQLDREVFVVTPELLFEVKANADIKRARFFPPHFGQANNVALDLTRSSNFSLHLLHLNSYIGIVSPVRKFFKTIGLCPANNAYPVSDR